MLAPDQSVTPVARRQQCGVDFEGRCTRQRPGTDIGGRYSIAALRRYEFPKAVTQLAKSYSVGPVIQMRLRLLISLSVTCSLSLV